MTNITGTVSTGSAAATFTGTTNDPVVAGKPFVGTITAVAPPPPQTTVDIGETTVLPYGDSGNGGLLLAQPITVSQQLTVKTLSFYATTAGGGLRLGIYSGAKPTTLVAQTAAFTPVVGWNTQPTTSTPSIAPGQYWLAYLPQTNSTGFRGNDTGGTSYYKYQGWGAMPATFPASPNSTGTHWSFYGTFLTGTTPGDTTAPSVPTNAKAVEDPGKAINLSWTAATDNVGVKGYNVFRNGTKIASPTTTTYADTGPLTAGTKYDYTVSAFDAAGNTSMPASFGSSVFPTINIPSPFIPIDINVSSVSVGNPPNANTVVGAVSVITSSGQPYPGTLVLGGADAAKFVLSNGGRLPCNLVVGPVDIAAGSYNITLTAPD